MSVKICHVFKPSDFVWCSRFVEALAIKNSTCSLAVKTKRNLCVRVEMVQFFLCLFRWGWTFLLSTNLFSLGLKVSVVNKIFVQIIFASSFCERTGTAETSVVSEVLLKSRCQFTWPVSWEFGVIECTQCHENLELWHLSSKLTLVMNLTPLPTLFRGITNWGFRK